MGRRPNRKNKVAFQIIRRSVNGPKTCSGVKMKNPWSNLEGG